MARRARSGLAAAPARALTLVLALALALGGGLSQAMAAPLSFAEFAARPQPKAAIRVAYGKDPSQFAELWLPSGPGPHPTVVMIHGGCWLASVASLELMNLAAQDLARRGMAVWNIEYRRVDQPGGGWPGTFQDTAAAIDALRGQAGRYRLKLDRLVFVGHSAGGHLGLWAAARARLPASSPLRAADPLLPVAVVSLGGLADLKALLAPGSQGCGPEPIAALTGPATTAHPDVYADTSPVDLLPFPARQVSVHGGLDSIAPVKVGEGYTAKARAAGAAADLVVIPAAGHFELIAPGGPAWGRIAGLIADLAGAPRPPKP